MESGGVTMSITVGQLERFKNSKIKATAINLKCVEDIDDIRNHLINKYGDLTENEDAFFVNGKRYLKPWLPRERIGYFRIRGDQFYIEAIESTATGRLNPRRSFFSIEKLESKDNNTILAMIDPSINGVIEYSII